jgi:hypothetical protein
MNIFSLKNALLQIALSEVPVEINDKLVLDDLDVKVLDN